MNNYFVAWFVHCFAMPSFGTITVARPKQESDLVKHGSGIGKGAQQWSRRKATRADGCAGGPALSKKSREMLLIVEDDAGLQRQMRWCFADYETVVASDRDTALALLQRHKPAVVTLDLGLPPDADGASEGLATLGQILALAPQTRVVIVSGNQDRANAVKAVALGAYDFCQKPFDPASLGEIVQRAFHARALAQ